VKNIVAECLGLLTSMPGMAADVIPTLLTLAQPVAGQRVGGRIVANTLKVALAKPQSPAAEPLTAIIDQFLPLCEFCFTLTLPCYDVFQPHYSASRVLKVHLTSIICIFLLMVTAL